MIQPNTSISTGTLQLSDLVPRCFRALHDLDSDAADTIARKNLCSFVRIALDEKDTEDEVAVNAAYELFNELCDALDALAPAGCYFGAHPGDGSDFGFWEDEVLEPAPAGWEWEF